MNYAYQELMKITREFRDLSTDLLNSNTNTLSSALNFFKTFCEENAIIADILIPIEENPFASDEWFNNAIKQQSSMAGSGDATLPTKKIEALKIVYDILWSDDAQGEMQSLIFSTMYTSSFDTMISRFHEHFTKLLVRYILRKLEDEIELLKPQATSLGNTFNTFNGPTNYATHSQHVNQNIQINNPELLEIVNQMRDMIDRSTLNLTDKQDALETIEMLENEVSKEKPSKTKVQKMLALLPAADTLIALADTLLSHMPA